MKVPSWDSTVTHPRRQRGVHLRGIQEKSRSCFFFSSQLSLRNATSCFFPKWWVGVSVCWYPTKRLHMDALILTQPCSGLSKVQEEPGCVRSHQLATFGGEGQGVAVAGREGR